MSPEMTGKLVREVRAGSSAARAARTAVAARARDPASTRPRREQQGDRARARRRREHGQDPRPAHPAQARPHLARAGRGLGDRARARRPRLKARRAASAARHPRRLPTSSRRAPHGLIRRGPPYFPLLPQRPPVHGRLDAHQVPARPALGYIFRTTPYPPVGLVRPPPSASSRSCRRRMGAPVGSRNNAPTARSTGRVERWVPRQRRSGLRRRHRRRRNRRKRKAWSVLIVSTLAFTVCFMVWMMFGVIGIPIKKTLDLNATQFGILTATPVLTGSLIRVPLGMWTDKFGGRIVMFWLMLVTRRADLADRLRDRVLAVPGARPVRRPRRRLVLGRHALRRALVRAQAAGLRDGRLRRRQLGRGGQQVRRARADRRLRLDRGAAGLRGGDARHGASCSGSSATAIRSTSSTRRSPGASSSRRCATRTSGSTASTTRSCSAATSRWRCG